MTYGSICSGIEAATVAWHPLGWQPAFFAEIEPFPCSVLAHHYPETPNLGDFTRIQPGDARPIDLLVGGTPCQSFSVAGKRLGLDDPRGNLTLEWLRLVQRLLPRWLVWENVPGVLSDDGGRTFGTILGTLAQLGYGFAYRVLDAQFFGLAQRRKRVFLVGRLGDWRAPAAVLLEPEGLSGHPAPSREAGAQIAPTIESGVNSTGGTRPPGTTVDTAESLIAFNMRGREDGAQVELAPDNKASLRAGHGGASRSFVCFDGTQITSSENHCNPRPGDPCHPIPAAGRPPAIAGTLKSNNGGGGFGSDPSETFLPYASGIRRLTPRECERLQGFPDDYTLAPHRGKPAADGPRYKALGNSMAVPVMRWIGERIAFVDQLTENRP